MSQVPDDSKIPEHRCPWVVLEDSRRWLATVRVDFVRRCDWRLFFNERERERRVIDSEESRRVFTVVVPIPVTMVVWCRQS